MEPKINLFLTFLKVYHPIVLITQLKNQKLSPQL